MWGLGGAVAASAVWAAAVLATGGSGGGDAAPGLAGYRYTTDLCAKTDVSPFTSNGFQKETGDSGTIPAAVRRPTIDTMQCTINMKGAGSGSSSTSYSSAYLYSSLILHKKQDPKTEFADGYLSYTADKSPSYHYTVDRVPGIGQEAYLVTQVNTRSSSNVYEILGVRDHGTTYQVTFSSYASGSAKLSSGKAAQLLEQSARSTLAALK
ncbi:hypothetical protein BIV57_08525 [Mangrovactinospora gilvigrisea]|uniref:DUF3558 domain-containing protein n=1 Tax=Mangrovactinospora gilvigrisea TaxID=1428644 RepID=A0A1J7BGZ1_9ACTN|nr:hypothetical protein BIV57_08525 [Mangrovactinospora gilvigrisea]